jgi:hypothetical protein
MSALLRHTDRLRAIILAPTYGWSLHLHTIRTARPVKVETGQGSILGRAGSTTARLAGSQIWPVVVHLDPEPTRRDRDHANEPHPFAPMGRVLDRPALSIWKRR